MKRSGILVVCLLHSFS